MNRSKNSGYKGLEAFHKYWGKKPVSLWRSLISELSEPDDVVLDPFLGSGLIARECLDLHRKFIGIDINPMSIELTRLFVDPPAANEFKRTIKKIQSEIEPLVRKLYGTPGGDIVSHVLWNGDAIEGVWAKKKNKREILDLTKSEMEALRSSGEFTSSLMRMPTFFDNARINSKSEMTLNDLFSDRALEILHTLLQMATNEKDPHISRAIKLTVTAAMGQMSRMVFAITNKGKVTGKGKSSTQIGSWVIGYWRPKQFFEVNAWNCFANKASRLVKALEEAEKIEVLRGNESSKCQLFLHDSEAKLKDLPAASIQLVITDPPHGDRIPYLELSEMWNSVLGYFVDFENELVVTNAKGREHIANSYTTKFESILKECARVIKPNGYLAVVFNSASVDDWKALMRLESVSSLSFLGRFDMNYSAGSVVQDNRDGGLKQDYVMVYSKSKDQAVRAGARTRMSAFDGWSIDLPEVVKNA